MTDTTLPNEPARAVGSASDSERKPASKRPAKAAKAPDKRLASVVNPRRTVTPSRPCYATYSTWVQTECGHILPPGLYFHGIRDEKETDNLICSPLEIMAITSDERGENFGRLIRLMSSGGGWREWAAPMEMLAGDGSELRAVLLNLGATIPFGQRRALMDYIMASNPKRHAMAATRTGWHGPALFVMPRKVIGAGDVVFQSSESGGHEYSQGGNLTAWQAEVADRCVGNPVLILSVCAALAGPLLAQLDMDGGGFHLLGDSSGGKSIALLASASVWGKPLDFWRTWNATSTGLEGVATLRNDTLLVLDEIGEAKPQDLGGIIYALGNGTGRQRGKVSGLPRPTQKWRVIVFSSGEYTIGKHMATAGAHIKAGQELRLLDVPVNRHYGVFDNLHGLELPHDPNNVEDCKGAGRVFAETLKHAAAKHYGHLGPAFVELLIKRVQRPDGSPMNAEEIERANLELRAVYAEMRKAFPVGTGQEARAAARFAIAALAGEMAIQAGLLPWAPGTAREAMVELYNDWADYRGRGQSEDIKILRAVLGFIDRHVSRFANAEGTDTAPTHNRAGWYRAHGDGRLYLFNSDALAEAAQGFDLKRVLACLDNAGAIEEHRTNGSACKQVRIPGEGRPYVYVINPAALQAALEE
ncbi:DUF927 domain-containing protein [Pseudomonas fluorescens]|uniref:DUF927 domain-containing protein n=1 Tax=Pseudomonas fluorescens TaxID=294 RepID=UPI0009B84C24|nr:DUF927 domain-containing protein [Pseudomonas fluorescens]